MVNKSTPMDDLYQLGAWGVRAVLENAPAELHTKQLIAKLHALRALESFHMGQVKKMLETENRPNTFCEGALDEISWQIDKVKEELARRKHVPNKQEAKKKRQEAAKRKRHR